MKSLIATLATIWRLAAPYYRSEDRWAGRLLLGAVVAIELSLVAIQVILNEWYNRFYNTLQDRDFKAFVSAILFFCAIAAIYTVLAVYQNYLNLWLQIRWRRWMTQTYLRQWLNTANHYRMQLLGDAADNPDQRIAEDIRMFIDLAGWHPADRHRPAQCLRHAGLVRRYFVEIVRRRAGAPVWPAIRHSGLSGLGGIDLCCDRHRLHALARLAAYYA